MTYIITYEKHDKAGNWTEHTSQGFNDAWLAYKEAQLLLANNSNVANVEVKEVKAAFKPKCLFQLVEGLKKRGWDTWTAISAAKKIIAKRAA